MHRPFSIPSYEFRMLLEAQRRRVIAGGERASDSIDLALARIREGRFGLCKRCGGEIDRGRLKADPTTERCKDCNGEA
jgi:RNA polymerase-binding transcription factor DksA